MSPDEREEMAKILAAMLAEVDSDEWPVPMPGGGGPVDFLPAAREIIRIGEREMAS